MNRLVLSVLSVLFIVFGASAQRVKNVSGYYEYAQGENETPSHAKMEAIRKARLQALEGEFGTLVEQSNITVVKGGRTEFHSLGLSDMRGDWLGDTKDAEVKTVMGEDGIIYFQARVWGRAREIVTAPIDLDAKLVRVSNGTLIETYEFNHEEQYFVTFRSPVDGYLALYMMDDDGTSSRLLPYRYSPKKSYKIKANKDYLFFSREKNNEGDDLNVVDEYVMFADKYDIEYSRLYVIFSPNEFTHPMDNAGGTVKGRTKEYETPREVDNEHMQDWLVKSRSMDKHMQVIRKDITIRK